MTFRNLVRYVLTSGAAAALAGCGGSQPPGGMPQTPSIAPARAGPGPTRNASAPYEVLYSFQLQHDSGSAWASGGLLNLNGALYGTTQAGGKFKRLKRRCPSCGTVYSITTGGLYNMVYGFRGAKRGDGADPKSGLIDVNGTLYGTTALGGSQNDGSVYSVSTTGSEKVLYSFTGGPADGARPQSDLLDVNGTLYGTTFAGGPYKSPCNGTATSCGTVYSITTSGEEKVLYVFQGGTDGGGPSSALINVGGTMYGTTAYGGGTGCGGLGCGTVYSITTSGQEKVLYSFDGPDGLYPNGLVNMGGTLYGTTVFGGTGCTLGFGCGTVYSITTSGNKKVLYNFRGGSDGDGPNGPLIEVKRKLYGTTYSPGGSSNGGTVYSVTTSGTEHVLHRFTDAAEGFYPSSGLVNVNGTLYGTTFSGGANGWGVIYSLTP
jgi:uncharacterized repeat protein (TIGR03803 family)